MSRSILTKWFALLPLALLLAGCGGGKNSPPPPPTGTVEGYVYVPEGNSRASGLAVFTRAVLTGYQPVPDATVEATVGMVTKSAQTDSSGHFVIEGLPEGQATVKITPPLGSVFGDLLTVTTTIQVVGNTTTTIGTGGQVSLVSHSADRLNVMVNHVDDTSWPRVKVSVTVTDPVSNSPIIGLTERDFVLTANGGGQTASVSQPGGSSSSPSATVLVLDRSGSMEGDDDDDQPLNDLKSAADVFISSLSTSDVAKIISFASYVTEDTGFTSDKSALLSAVYALASGGDTALYDAVESAVNAVASRPESRKAVIVMTDGGENASESASLDSVIALAQSRGILVYAVGLHGYAFERSRGRRDAPKLPKTRSESDLVELAASTGGEYFYAPSSSALVGAYTAIAQRTVNYYVVEFTYAGGDLQNDNYAITVRADYAGLTNTGVYTAWSPFRYDGFEYPVKFTKNPPDYYPGEYTQFFGDENALSNPPRHGHLGADLATTDRNVRAAAAGWVARKTPQSQGGEWGNYVILGHDIPGAGRFYTLYAHLADFDPDLSRIGPSGTTPSASSRVRRGQRLGTEGNTGFSSGASGVHLHFAVMSALPSTPQGYAGQNFGNWADQAEAKEFKGITCYNPIKFVQQHAIGSGLPW